MSLFSSSITRAPNAIYSQTVLSSLTRNNLALARVQEQLATGNRVNRGSDDPVAASAISVLDGLLARDGQRLLNLGHAAAVNGGLDDALGEVTDLVRSAQSIASSQIGVQSDSTTRAQQAQVVDSLIRQLLQVSNRRVAGLSLFGGDTPSVTPVTELYGGFRYNGRGTGLLTDLGTGDRIPITIGGDNAIGETSARQKSTVDLNPALTPLTRADELRGARGLGIAPGSITFTANGGPAATIDLTGVQSVAEIIDRVTGAIRQYEAANSTTVLTAAGVTISGGSLRFNVAAGGTLSFTEVANGTTGADLGLTAAAFTPASTLAGDLNPRLTLATPLSAVPSLPSPLGSVVVRFTQPGGGGGGGGGGSVVRTIDLSSATSIDDVRNLIEVGAPGVRVRISDSGNGLDVLNEVSGASLSIEEAPGTSFAGLLGIRTFGTGSRLSDFNNGRGVQVVDGATNPVTGALDPALNRDFRVTLGNGQWFDVDLRPQDTVDVASVLARINAEFAAAVGSQNNPAAPALAAGQFSAGVVAGPNGLALTQTVGPGAISIENLNNSQAAEQLGLLSLTLDGGSGAYIAQDRSTIRVNNLFSDLLDLKQALLTDSSAGITLAGSGLGKSADRAVAAQAVVGSFGQRISQAKDQLESQSLLNEKTRSDLKSADYAEVATRFTQLQTQLEATLRSASILGSRTLFDFLG